MNEYACIGAQGTVMMDSTGLCYTIVTKSLFERTQKKKKPKKGEKKREEKMVMRKNQIKTTD